MKCCISGGNIIRILFLLTELFKFEIQKCGQILCAHKPYFLMPGHILCMCVHIGSGMVGHSLPEIQYILQTFENSNRTY